MYAYVMTRIRTLRNVLVTHTRLSTHADAAQTHIHTRIQTAYEPPRRCERAASHSEERINATKNKFKEEAKGGAKAGCDLTTELTTKLLKLSVVLHYH